MSNIFIINAHHPYPFSEGKLNASLVDLAKEKLESGGHEVQTVKSFEEYDIVEQLTLHQWADAIILQSPVNWMGVPWSFKKYMDEVYSSGMEGALCNGDGRSDDEPTKNYGVSGTLSGNYMLSLTFNAPPEAFNDENEFLFQGKSIDDLFYPIHTNFRFFGLKRLETFAAYDVIKNPQIENDMKRYEEHLAKEFNL